MIGLFLLLALQTAPAGQDFPPPENDPAADNIVITARNNICEVRFADKTMTDAEFNRRAEEWKNGKPVRVVSRGDADFACVRKIANKLFAKGVMKIVFVDPNGKPALPFDPPSNLPKYDASGAPANLAGSSPSTSAWAETRAREHSFVSRSAAQLILQGKCDEARTMALKEGDLEAAAAVVEICRK